MFETIKAYAVATWKAIGAGVAAAAVYVYSAGVFGLDQKPLEAVFTAWQTIGDWTVGQWGGLVAAVLAAYGITWAFPANKTAE